MSHLNPSIGAALLMGCVACGPIASSEPDPSARWTIQASAAAGTAIMLSTPDGTEIARLACRVSPADLYVTTPALDGAADAAMLRINGATYELEPEAGLPASAGLVARGELTRALVGQLQGATTVAIASGRKRLDLPQVPAGTIATFAAACRHAVER